jgi:acyl-coenzyme A synthetase/AMP-(fatty) acid ligase
MKTLLSQMPPEKNLYLQSQELLQNHFLISSNGESVTYGDIDVFVKEFQEFITPRSIAFVLCSNTIGSVIGLPILVRNGVVPLLLDMNIAPHYLGELIRNYEPEYMLVPSDLVSAFPTWKIIKHLFNYVLITNGNFSKSDIDVDLCCLLTTSGSTGSPKLVRLSYQNITSNAFAIAQYLDIKAHDRVITTLPMNYSYGFSIINSHFIRGASIYLNEESVITRNFWNQMNEHKISTFNGVPQTYEMLRRMRFHRMELPSLKTMTQAGGKLSAETANDKISYCSRNKISFFTMYGQTEASPRMSYVPADAAHTKSGSIGIAIPDGKLSLLDADNNEILDSHISGELCYQGKNVFQGYAQNRIDLAKGNETKGFLRTGDLAYKDESGFYFIVGRLNRFVKIFGNRVNLDDLELLLNETYSECACTGIEDQIKIFSTNPDVLVELRNMAATITGLNRQAFVPCFVDTIPRNESGKIKYGELK